MSHPLPPGSTIDGRYRVVHTIAEGGLSWVYAAVDGGTRQRCAVKVLKADLLDDDSIRERFDLEARACDRIASDHVVRVIDTGRASNLDNAPFIVMEHLDGVDLYDFIEQHGPVEPERVVAWLQQLALLLDIAHGQGIVHRDLKPENIFLELSSKGETIKVLDFGVAKLIEEHGDQTVISATRTGQVIGTPMYMSPEQCLARRHLIGPPTDIWGLGLLTFKLLIADDIWLSNTLTGLVKEICYVPFPIASTRGSVYGDAFDDWLNICCARDPAERFQSASAAVRALTVAVLTRRPPPPRPSAPH